MEKEKQNKIIENYLHDSIKNIFMFYGIPEKLISKKHTKIIKQIMKGMFWSKEFYDKIEQIANKIKIELDTLSDLNKG